MIIIELYIYIYNPETEEKTDFHFYCNLQERNKDIILLYLIN